LQKHIFAKHIFAEYVLLNTIKEIRSMNFRKSPVVTIISGILIVFFIFSNRSYGQMPNTAGVNTTFKKYSQKLDTITTQKKVNIITAEPDTNFTWEKYGAFLKKISDTSKYIVLPLNEFRKTFNDKKIIIGLRHDIDVDLNVAYQFSQVETKLGFRSTYFILHSAPYYLENPNNMEVHTDKIIPILKSMQNDKHFEIGWHNDLVTLQVVYNINPVTFLHNELNWLRSNGIKIYGTASHGSTYCKTYHYLNYYFFEECTFPVVTTFVNNITVPKDGKSITLLKGKLADFNLQYEAYFLNNNKAFSDATITNGIRWNIGMLDLSLLQPGDRAIILLHPTHWHRASVHANIESFSIPGQKSCSIDTVNSRIRVEMPYGTNKGSLVATFYLSAGAYAKVSGRQQASRNTPNNFNNSVIYRVYAENRDIQREWTVVVHIAEPKANFTSFTVPGQVGLPKIDTLKKTITAEVARGHSRDSLRPSFVLSEYSHAFIGAQEQISDVNYINFSNPVCYIVVSNGGQFSEKWKVTIHEQSDKTDMLIYPNPSDGKTTLQFIGVKSSPTTVDIFNSLGEKVFSDKIKKTGDFTVEEDLKKLGGGVYIVRYSELKKSEIFVIKKH
jgi:hypothetical protein